MSINMFANEYDYILKISALTKCGDFKTEKDRLIAIVTWLEKVASAMGENNDYDEQAPDLYKFKTWLQEQENTDNVKHKS